MFQGRRIEKELVWQELQCMAKPLEIPVNSRPQLSMHEYACCHIQRSFDCNKVEPSCRMENSFNPSDGITTAHLGGSPPAPRHSQPLLGGQA